MLAKASEEWRSAVEAELEVIFEELSDLISGMARVVVAVEGLEEWLHVTGKTSLYWSGRRPSEESTPPAGLGPDAAQHPGRD